LGGNLVRALIAQGHEVTALARSASKARELLGESPRLRVALGDMEDVAGFAPSMAGHDVLFHAAAYFREYYGNGDHWAKLQRINVDGTIALLTHAERLGVSKTIYVSSSGVIGTHAAGAVDESSPPGPMQQTNLYFKSKVIAEQRLLAWIETHELPVVQILPGWIWGPGDAAPTTAGQLALDFMNRKLPGIVDGRINVVDARDVARSMINATERGRSGERYIVSNQPATIEELMSMLAVASGVAGPKLRIPYRMAVLVAYASEALARMRGTDTLMTVEGIRTLQDRATLSSAKAVRELGASFRPLEETVRDVVEWYLAHQPERVTNPELRMRVA
jgi:dihydroflavonol-4-reductase